MAKNDCVIFSIPEGVFITISKDTYEQLLELSDRKEKPICEVIDELARRENFRLDYEEIQDYGRT